MSEAAKPSNDYSLLSKRAEQAVERGLSFATWYQTPIDRGELKQFLQRKDQPALRDTTLWLGLLACSGALVVFTWGSWWVILPLFVYGTLYGSAADSRWHECGHNTAFKTKWMNQIVYHLASFMLLREPHVWRRSHTRHHIDTIIVGRDREIVAPRPPDIPALVLNLFALKHGYNALISIFRHAAGRISDEERTFIPQYDFPKIFVVARIWLLIFSAIALACLYWSSILPAVLIGLPTFYGAWLMLVLGITQHVGLAEDVLDYRLNTRTIYLNPVLRFLYLNMNYHLEHHMYPSVPYYNLPRLHELIKHDCPPPYHGLLETYREIIPTLKRQLRQPAFFAERHLPAEAIKPSDAS